MPDAARTAVAAAVAGNAVTVEDEAESPAIKVAAFTGGEVPKLSPPQRGQKR